MKILVHLHLYYQDQLDYMLEKLSNIKDYEYDLYITVTEKTEMLEKKIHLFNKDAKIILVDNIGYDVYPFYRVIQEINLEDYDFILKIHTKAPREKIVLFEGTQYQKTLYNYDWRNLLISALIGSKNKFKENIALFQKHKDCGAIGYAQFIIPAVKEEPLNFPITEKLLQKYDLTYGSAYFIVGTMFLCRSHTMEKFKNMHFEKDDFKDGIQKTGSTGSLAHSLETIFGIIIYSQGLKIYPQKAEFIDEHKNDIKKISFITILRLIFSVENRYNHKVITILGFKIKIKRRFSQNMQANAFTK